MLPYQGCWRIGKKGHLFLGILGDGPFMLNDLGSKQTFLLVEGEQGAST